MSQTLHQSEAAPSTQTLPPIPNTHGDSLPRELLDHIDRLRLILPVISVSVMALNRQDADADTDIAFVLHEHACEPLGREIERIEPLPGVVPLAISAGGGAPMNTQEQPTAPNASGKPRRLTVGYKPLKSPGVEVPYLRLRGRWLRDAGFEIGRSVKVEVHAGRLTIEPAD